MVYVDDGIFLVNYDLKLQDAIDAGLNIEDQGHPADYVGVNSRKQKMVLVSSPNALLSTLSLKTSDLRMQR